MRNQKLVLENHKFVKYIFYNDHYNKYANGNDEDILSEGYLGLCEAADRYDERIGDFGKYASWYIRGYMNSYIKHNMLGQISSHSSKLHKPILYSSLNASVNDEEGDTLLSDLIPDKTQNIDDMISYIETRNKLYEAYEKSSKKHGIDILKLKELEFNSMKIAKILDISKQRVSQIESKAKKIYEKCAK